jgi:hypothetical protein
MLPECAEPAVEAVSESRASAVTRRIFSFPVMLAGMLTVLAVLTVRGRFDDPDMWWHLKTGEIIWNTHAIPRVDLFSYTTNHHAWTAHEWLSQLTMYGAYHLGGYTGLMVWLCVFASAFLIAQYALCSLYSGNAKVAFVGGLVAWLFSTIGLAIRPQLIGYLLLTIELLIIHLGRTRNTRWFWCLPPLFAVWVNCHGSFIFGLAVLGVFLVTSFLDFRMGLIESLAWPSRERNTLMIALVLSVAALFVNPVGIKQVLYPLDTLTNQKIGLALVAEWQQVQFDDPRAWVLLAISGGILLMALLRRREIRMDELLLLGLGLGLAVPHQRMLFVFGALTAPTVCRLLSDAWDHYDVSRDRRWPNAVTLALASVAIFFAFPKEHDLESQVSKTSPVKAVNFIHRTKLSGNMLNEYVYGGYLIWAAPDHPVFVDGRSDVYDWTGVLREYGEWINLQSDPGALLSKHKIDFCLLARDSAIGRVLPLLPDWKNIYSDEMMVIFARTSAYNRHD